MEKTRNYKYKTSGVRRAAVGGFKTPRNGKNCCRKIMLFPKFLFLATYFPRKQRKIQIFHCIFLKISKTIVFFVQTRENLPRGFELFWQNRRKYSIFGNFLQEFFCKFSKILPRPGSSAPGPPTLNPPPTEIFSCVRL